MAANPRSSDGRWCALETDPSGRARLLLRQFKTERIDHL